RQGLGRWQRHLEGIIEFHYKNSCDKRWIAVTAPCSCALPLPEGERVGVRGFGSIERPVPPSPRPSPLWGEGEERRGQSSLWPRSRATLAGKVSASTRMPGVRGDERDHVSFVENEMRHRRGCVGRFARQWLGQRAHERGNPQLPRR